MKINKPGIIIFFTSMTLSLLILEGSLRLTGIVFQESRNNSFRMNLEEANSYDSERDYEKFKVQKETNNTIWAIGDSFTNAGNVDSNQSYPAYLFKILQAKKYNYNVVNLGQCEDPTWGVYNRLKDVLENTPKKEIPGVVIVLTGVSDPFYFTLSGVQPMKREKQKFTAFYLPQIPWYKELRIYKAYRHIKLELMNRKLSRNGGKFTPEILESLNTNYEEIVRNKPVGYSQWLEYELKIQSILKNHREFVDGSKNEFFFKDKARFVFNTLVMPRIRYFTGKLSYNEALEVLLKFGRDFPEYFWSDERNVPFSLHVMSQLMLFQSKYTSVDLNKFLVDSSRGVPHLRKSELYKMANRFFLSKKDIEAQVLGSRKETWNKIIELSHSYDFKLVVQTYASDFKEANRMVRAVSQKSNILLVDNNKEFKKKIKDVGRENLFADDNHFQPLGYEIMAQNIFNSLETNNYIKK
ncbi:MAG: lysophospholipase L1-like esterase [Bacteriovoracaceae bacterium]|jgi:lysophospholipase L1-like esterase